MQAALRELYEEMDILPAGELLPIDGFTITLNGKEEINQFFCTDFIGEPQADGKEMKDAKFVSLDELFELPLFPPFAEAVERFLDMIQPQDMELDRADFDENKVKREKNGRFGVKPDSDKGNNTTKPLTNPKQKDRMNVSESLPMTAKEKAKVTHDINNIFHAKYQGKRNCVIRTRSNEPDSPSYYYKFKNHGFDSYDIYHKTKID